MVEYQKLLKQLDLVKDIKMNMGLYERSWKLWVHYSDKQHEWLRKSHLVLKEY